MNDRWQQELQNSVTRVADLLHALELDPDELPFARDIKDFPTRVPRPYLARIRKRDAGDPLLRQVLPVADETIHSPGYAVDPVGDLGAHRGGGVLHKYHGRVLLVVTGACAIHCRYCFRRHFPYAGHALARSLDRALAYVARDASVEEVILSGGDPLSLSNPRLFELCRRIESIAHVRRIRIHTRLPIVVPSRLEDELCNWLNRRPKRYLVVFHINHPAEIATDVERAVSRLTAPTLMNQAVLLKGVNDDARTLADLSRKCFGAGILPYYLHLLDRVRGAAHFEVDAARAQALMRELATLLPGYLVPRLARDDGGPSKQFPLQHAGSERPRPSRTT